MTEDLRDALTGIHGIGDAKADEILEVLDDHDDHDAGVAVDELLSQIPRGKAQRRAREVLDV